MSADAYKPEASGTLLRFPTAPLIAVDSNKPAKRAKRPSTYAPRKKTLLITLTGAEHRAIRLVAKREFRSPTSFLRAVALRSVGLRPY